ncbi:uncharacterized protein CTRU02_200919 [Colletotrichum truncatum]|uniref:Uncharacterized protein n=1 Tax=Colletotrichum truncatum TaxID=5467 RepID=A0ACC3ZG03_COLTU|nr:uncharacterized protein CTRU02_00686 [Colletotrichum truncatum]KAF6801937.1 hypothetical protein CTRU02_00686 [Colletotrichum truncatum]
MPAPKPILMAILAAGHFMTAFSRQSTLFAPVFEQSDFDVTKALVDLGVDVAKIPDLSDSNKRLESGCSIACSSLKHIFGDEAVETRDEEAFSNFTRSYWSSNQAEVNPYCVFKPSKPSHVSVVVLLSRLTQCPFAAKSGGHAAMAGASNVEDGITISLTNMKEISLSADKKVVSVQPGNVWGDVFAELAKFDVSVIGGRLSNIGVGGLTTGGGISFFSNLYGWACDNVESFDVVIANGAIVRASPTHFSDLYWALRGGGNNFGLVVSFNLLTIPLPGGKMWGGLRVYTEDKFPEVSKAIANLVENSADDPKAGFWGVWAFFDGIKIANPALYYSEPDSGNATIWSELNAIDAVDDTTKNRLIHEWTHELMLSSPLGLREVYYAITTKADQEILDFAQKLFYENLHKVLDIPGILPALIAQGITVPQMQNMKKNGGNVLGLNAEDGPVYLIHICAMWENEEDDATVYQFMSDILKQIAAEAKARGVNNDYAYMNYASQYQDVISSYGATKKEKLKNISQKYDPQQVFQKLQPGYFKLDRAPIPDTDYFSTSF